MDTIFNRLVSVSQFTLQAQSINQWQASGQGRVKIDHPEPLCVIWREQGHWDEHFDKLEFTNVYRWSGSTTQHLSLAHLRFGDAHPVQLVDLTQISDHHWQAVKPHTCDKDEYRLDLLLTDQQLTLHWQINGPNKQQKSTVCYS